MKKRQTTLYYDDPKNVVEWLKSYDVDRTRLNWKIWEEFRQQHDAIVLIIKDRKSPTGYQ